MDLGRARPASARMRRRAYGFHSADAALALVMLACGPINLVLPRERPAIRTAA